MKLKNIATIATTSILALSSITIASERVVAEVSKNTASEFGSNTDTSSLIAGNFVTSSHLSSFVAVSRGKKAKGNFKIVEAEGKKFIEFSDDFKVSQGPDLEIILHKDKVVASRIAEKDYISLAPIKNFSGSQRYEIPANVNLADFASVAVWCEDFNVTFGYAQL